MTNEERKELIQMVNGVDEIEKFVGTRKEIYNLINEKNPMAIIDFRQATVEINGIRFLIILKKVDKAFRVSIIWQTGGQCGNNGKQYIF